jgi:hypothetical protein
MTERIKPNDYQWYEAGKEADLLSRKLPQITNELAINGSKVIIYCSDPSIIQSDNNTGIAIGYKGFYAPVFRDGKYGIGIGRTMTLVTRYNNNIIYMGVLINEHA